MANVFTKLKAVDKVTKVFKKIGNSSSKSIGKIGRSVKKVNIDLKGLGKNLGLAGKIGGIALAGFSFASITGQIQETIQTGLLFDKTMVSAAAKFPGEIKKGTEEFAALQSAAMGVGRTTEFNASQAADGLNFLALAGFNAEQSIAALPGVVNLATAAELDLASASDIATDTLGAFNLTAKDSVKLQANLARVSNVMAKTSTTANTSIAQLFETIKTAGPVANSAKIDIEEFTAAAGLLANAGIKGEKAGTALKNIILRLQAPAGKGAKALKRLGISIADSNGEMKPMARLLDELNNKLPQGVKRAAALNDIFGKIPIAGVNVLLKAGGNELRKYTSELKDSAGFVTKLSDVMRDQADGAFKQMDSAVEGLRLSLFTAFAPALIGVTKLVTKLVNWITIGFEKLGIWGPIILDVAAALTVAVVVMGTLVGAFFAVNAAIAAFNFLFVASPIGWIALALAAVVFVIITLVRFWGNLGEVAKRFFKIVLVGLGILFPPLGALLIAIKLISFAFGKIKGLFGKKLSAEIEEKRSDALEIKKENQDENEKDVEDLKSIQTPQSAQTSITSSLLEKTNENIEKNTTEVTIKDETGRAEVTNSTGAPENFRMDFMPLSWGV